MNHGHQIIRNKKKLLFFFILIILIFYSNIADSTTVLGALNKVSCKISKIKVDDNNEIRKRFKINIKKAPAESGARQASAEATVTKVIYLVDSNIQNKVEFNFQIRS